MGFKSGVCCLFVAVILSCDETLPEYKDPQNLFRSSLEAHFFYGPYEGVLDSTMKAYVNAVNIFDETFNAQVNIDGFVEIILVKDTTYHKTFRLTEDEIFSATNYIKQQRLLTIDPGDSLRLRVSWNFIDDNGRNLRNDIFRYKLDVRCPVPSIDEKRWFAPPEFFIIRGQLKLFDKTGYLFPKEIVVELCHITKWNDKCLRFPLDGGCDYYRQYVAPGQ